MNDIFQAIKYNDYEKLAFLCKDKTFGADDCFRLFCFLKGNNPYLCFKNQACISLFISCINPDTSIQIKERDYNFHPSIKALFEPTFSYFFGSNEEEKIYNAIVTYSQNPEQNKKDLLENKLIKKAHVGHVYTYLYECNKNNILLDQDILNAFPSSSVHACEQSVFIDVPNDLLNKAKQMVDKETCLTSKKEVKLGIDLDQPLQSLLQTISERMRKQESIARKLQYFKFSEVYDLIKSTYSECEWLNTYAENANNAIQTFTSLLENTENIVFEQYESTINMIQPSTAYQLFETFVSKVDDIMKKLSFAKKSIWKHVVFNTYTNKMITWLEYNRSDASNVIDILTKYNALNLFSELYNQCTLFISGNVDIQQENYNIVSSSDATNYLTFDQAYVNPLVDSIMEVNRQFGKLSFCMENDLIMMIDFFNDAMKSETSYVSQYDKQKYKCDIQADFITNLFIGIIKTQKDVDPKTKDSFKTLCDILVKQVYPVQDNYKECIKELQEVVLPQVLDMPKYSMWLLKLLKTYKIHTWPEHIKKAKEQRRSEAFITLLKKMSLYSDELMDVVEPSKVPITSNSNKEDKNIALNLSWSSGSISVNINKGNIQVKEVNGQLTLLYTMNNSMIQYAKAYVYFFPYKMSHYKTWLEVRIPQTQEARSQGLMYVRKLPEHMGMVFQLPTPNYLSLWMKDTLIPLDMIFVFNNRIIYIHKDAKPMDETQISSEGIVDYAIEVNAGFCDKYKLKVGDQIGFRMII